MASTSHPRPFPLLGSACPSPRAVGLEQHISPWSAAASSPSLAPAGSLVQQALPGLLFKAGLEPTATGPTLPPLWCVKVIPSLAMPTPFPHLSTSHPHLKPHTRHQLFAVLRADLFFQHYGLFCHSEILFPQMTLFYVFFKIYS